MVEHLEFHIPSSHSNKQLSFDLHVNTKSNDCPLVIFLHGFKGFKDWGHFNLIAKHFANNGFAFLKLNFSHNGTAPHDLHNFVDLEAFGNNNFSKEIADVDDLLNYIQAQSENFDNINTQNITLIGHSKGGATALIKGINDPRVKRVITWNGVIYLKDKYATSLDTWKEAGVIYIENARTNQQMPLYFQLAEDVLQHEKEFDIPELLKNTDKKTLAIHSKEDQTISVEEPLSVKEHFTQIEILEQGSHTFDGEHPHNKELSANCLHALKVSQEFIL